MNWLLRLLFDWFFVMLYGLMVGLLHIVNFLEQIFDVFAGTVKVSYNGQQDYLINIFFGQNIISNAFWGITAIAMTLCFAFTIVAVARKATDIGGTVKNSIGQIISSAGMACITFLLLSGICIATVNLTNVVLVQLNYVMKNAYSFSYSDGEVTKEFSQAELTSMTRIMNTIANYSLNPSPTNRYNINSCFNACRSDLFSLYSSGFFNFTYDVMDESSSPGMASSIKQKQTHHTWQSAIYMLGTVTDFQTAQPLDQYNEGISQAITTIMDELKYNKNFKPVRSVVRKAPGDLSVDTIIFLTASMDAPWSNFYKQSSSFTDPLRLSYYDGTKSYQDLKTVRKDFDIWLIRYEIGYLACIVFIVVMVRCIFIFITRLINIILLYLVSPFFVSSMPLDDGQRFQTWRTAFVIQLLSGFGAVVAMRLYLMMIPIIMDDKLVLFENNALNYMARLLFLLGGAFAVVKSVGLITDILAGTPGAAARSDNIGDAMGAMAMGKAMAATSQGGHAISQKVHQMKDKYSQPSGGGAAHDLPGGAGGTSSADDQAQSDYYMQNAAVFQGGPMGVTPGGEIFSTSGSGRPGGGGAGGGASGGGASGGGASGGAPGGEASPGAPGGATSGGGTYSGGGSGGASGGGASRAEPTQGQMMSDLFDGYAKSAQRAGNKRENAGAPTDGYAPAAQMFNQAERQGATYDKRAAEAAGGDAQAQQNFEKMRQGMGLPPTAPGAQPFTPPSAPPPTAQQFTPPPATAQEPTAPPPPPTADAATAEPKTPTGVS